MWQIEPTTAIWFIGLLLAVVGVLLRIIFNLNAREIDKLRSWRHHDADPAIRLTGWLKERVDRLERERDGRSRRDEEG